MKVCFSELEQGWAGVSYRARLKKALLLLAACCLLVAPPMRLLAAQSSGAPSNTAPSSGAPLSGAPDGSAQSSADANTRITKTQAKDLFRSVDEILKFDSDATKLPILHPVKRKLTSREAVNKYVLKKFEEDESAKRMQRAEIVLKKFGLLDRDFNLRPFLVSLLTEQIAGFYDNKTKTVNLLDWIPAEQQKPVMAHELTHALQDQHVNLETWSQQGATDLAKNAAEDNQHIATDETDDTRDAVLEGQAMLAFIDYSLRPYGKTVATAPGMVSKFMDSMGDDSDSPVMARAPLLLQQSLLFPYREGLNFERTLLMDRGTETAFAGALDRPPTSSYEIMNPPAYLAHQPVPVLHMPDIHPLIDKDYAPYDVGVMGALDVRILTQLFGGDQSADALTPAWDGGIYYAAQRKSAVTDAEKKSTASLALMYYSRWKNADSARSFARVYADELARKYDVLKRRKADEQQIDDAGAEREEQVYTTNEGDVLIVLVGRSVFISEGFDLALARKLQALMSAAQAEGPIGIASAGKPGPLQPGSELTLPLAAMLRSVGAMKAGLPQVSVSSR
ncbi:MAG: hypothetical protein ACYCSN_03125 [Acidobacteriaceae bacterium]